MHACIIYLFLYAAGDDEIIFVSRAVGTPPPPPSASTGHKSLDYWVNTLGNISLRNATIRDRSIVCYEEKVHTTSWAIGSYNLQSDPEILNRQLDTCIYIKQINIPINSKESTSNVGLLIHNPLSRTPMHLNLTCAMVWITGLLGSLYNYN